MVDVSGPKVWIIGILIGSSFSAGEIHLQAKVGADANTAAAARAPSTRPRDDLSMFSGDLYQESVEFPEPAFQLVGRYICPSMARPVLPLLVGF
jgi:hypothetical protein